MSERPFTSSNPEEIRAFLASRVQVEPSIGDKTVVIAEIAGPFTLAEIQAMQQANEMAMRSIERLTAELAQARAERDRYIGRVKVLEKRLDNVREAVR